MTFNIGVQIFYILLFSGMTGLITGLLYPDSEIWEPDIIIIGVVVLLIDFVWFTTYWLSL